MSGPAPGEPVTAHLLRLERQLAFLRGALAGVAGGVALTLGLFWLIAR